MLEEPEHMRLMNKAELTLHADQKKTLLYAEKEQLFFAIEEKSHEADLTEKGRNLISPNDPEAFMMPDITTEIHNIDSGPEQDPRKRMELKQKLQSGFEAKAQKIHAISQLLKAYCLYQKDVQYVVQDNKVIIVDENTGRLMTGRRWSDGLHQAVEAKEGVLIERETQTLATVTIQNYFRLYTKLAGMTGTAETEAQEFFDIYKLGVLVIPTNRPCVRKDANDSVYKTKREKYNAVVKEIQEVHAQGRPILVGTISVEVSEHLSRMLKKADIVHSVLNAKFHEQEAEIITRAGQRGSVTIATNMAGRGTDIKLGAGVAERRADCMCWQRSVTNRAGLIASCGGAAPVRGIRVRPISSSDWRTISCACSVQTASSNTWRRWALEEGQELEHPLLNRSIEQAQRRVEQHNFQIRKRTLEYDDVMNKQREVIYGFRNEIIHGQDVRDRLLDIMEEVVVQKVEEFTTGADVESWQLRPLADWVNLNFPLGMPEEELVKAGQFGSEQPVAGSLYDGLTPAQFAVCTFITEEVRKSYNLKISFEDATALESVERYTILSAIDKRWQEHLYDMDSLRYSIGLRGYGQRDPLIEYKAEAFKMFDELMVNIKTEICHNIFRSASSMMAFENFLRNAPQKTLHQESSAFGAQGGSAPAKAGQKQASDIVSEAAEAIEKARPIRSGPKVGRNDPCPCGSGKKYKQCCGK